MRLRSTGLGATELFGDVTDMEKSMSGVLMRVKISKPVVWRVRILLQQRDLRKMVLQLLKPRNIWFMIKTLLSNPNASTQVDEKPETNKGARGVL